uniref:Transposase IS200-like domain-containing protein n=1 Tax=Candidatus Methanogaster sp. ANME-2c ERB4 TaxID=2759911 RepID=A0A7G9YKI8_9EURY|nr:hypothetical protein IMNOINEI_00022 [Methanosarcinales archaeon ANME-2c ERB4]
MVNYDYAKVLWECFWSEMSRSRPRGLSARHVKRWIPEITDMAVNVDHAHLFIEYSPSPRGHSEIFRKLYSQRDKRQVGQDT